MGHVQHVARFEPHPGLVADGDHPAERGLECPIVKVLARRIRVVLVVAAAAGQVEVTKARAARQVRDDRTRHVRRGHVGAVGSVGPHLVRHAVGTGQFEAEGLAEPALDANAHEGGVRERVRREAQRRRVLTQSAEQ
jgi:hypothetical protein